MRSYRWEKTGLDLEQKKGNSLESLMKTASEELPYVEQMPKDFCNFRVFM